MKQPYVSCIVPVYNEASYLKRCLVALKNQRTAIPFEIIVVDNNSTDASHKIATSARVRVVPEKTQGASSARNAGALAARGTILAFVDADCEVQPNHVERIAYLVTRYPSIAAFTGTYIYYDGGSFMRWLTDRVKFYSLYFYYVRMLFGVQAAAGGNLVVQANIYKKIGGYDQSLNHVIMADDFDFAVRLQRAGYFILFDPQLIVVTSFRRISRTPLATVFIRTGYFFKHLLKKYSPLKPLR